METHDSDPQEGKPLISVIVPIYNVEQYIRKCLDSLKEQTLKQIEVICIDDGSTDGSGRIAKEYVSDNWPRFRMIYHEINRGLSAARNRGIDEAKADWIMFVDSDDWVDKMFCKLPFEVGVGKNAEIVIFNTERDGLIDELAAHEYGGVVAWNKLYRKHLFDNIRYPEGHVFEDRAITHKLVHKADRIVLLQDTLYHHVKRKKSITRTYEQSIKKDWLVSETERYNDLLSYGFPNEKLIDSLCSAAIGYLVSTKEDGTKLYSFAKDIVNKTERIPKSLNKKQKIAWMAWKTNKILFFLLCKVTGRMKIH